MPSILVSASRNTIRRAASTLYQWRGIAYKCRPEIPVESPREHSGFHRLEFSRLAVFSFVTFLSMREDFRDATGLRIFLIPAVFFFGVFLSGMIDERAWIVRLEK